MNPVKGYRLKVSGVADLSKVLDGFRRDATRLLARRYGSLVAREATWAVDKWSLGLSEGCEDYIAASCETVRKRLVSTNPLLYPDLNCVLSLYFVHDAVLAAFQHGDDRYRKAWESLREVISWSWSGTDVRPRGISERAWDARGRYWQAAMSGPAFGRGLRFTLIEAELPTLGWGAIRRYLPGWEERIARATLLLDRDNKNPEEVQKRAGKMLLRDLGKEIFIPGKAVSTLRSRAALTDKVQEEAPLPAKEKQTVLLEPPAAPEKPEPGAAERMRREAGVARKNRASSRISHAPDDPEKAASIDHADIVVASDGRVFVAAPYVGLDTESRVFLQVGDGHIAVSQGGMQFGYVTDVPGTAIDLLRTCRTVILVEVARRERGGRLLRARHVAIVSDISLSDSLSISLGGFRRPASARGEKEIREWESGQ